MLLKAVDYISVSACRVRNGWNEHNLDAKYVACERAFVHYGSTMFHWLWLCYVGMYFTVFSILCPLFSFSFFLSYLFSFYHFWWITIYKTQVSLLAVPVHKVQVEVPVQVLRVNYK